MNFELPELNNFLKILQIEEDESLAQVNDFRINGFKIVMFLSWKRF